jgi:hypothetical protein
MQAIHTMVNSAPPGSSQVWLTDSGAPNYMTAYLNNLTLASPYPTADTIQTANGEGLTVSHVGQSIINSSMSSLKLDSVLLVPQLTQNLLLVHRLCLDNNCWLILMHFAFGFRTKPPGGFFTEACAVMACILYMLFHYHLLLSHTSSGILGQLVQSNLWHHRLRHPTNFVVSLTLNKAHICFNSFLGPHTKIKINI